MTGDDSGAIGVTQDTSVSLDGYAAEIHLVVTPDDSAAPIFTTWDNTTLKKGNRDAYGNIKTVAVGNSDVTYKFFTITAYMTTSETSSRLDAVKAAVWNASTPVDMFYIEFDDQFDNDDENENTSEAELQANEVYYYTSDAEITKANWTKSNEVNGGTTALQSI